MNIFKIITASQPPISIEHYHQNQPNDSSYLQTKQTQNFTSQYFSDDVLVKGNKSSQNIEVKHESQKSETISEPSADIPKEASQKIGIGQVSEQIELNEKGVKNEEKPECSKEKVSEGE